MGYPQYMKTVKNEDGEDVLVVDDVKEQNEAGKIYLVYELYKNNSAEKEFERYIWDVSKVLPKNLWGKPTTMKLTDLIRKAKVGMRDD